MRLVAAINASVGSVCGFAGLVLLKIFIVTPLFVVDSYTIYSF